MSGSSANPEAACLYERLGLERSAGDDEIKRAYRKLAMQFHPDKNASEAATAKFQRISEAYAVLSDASKRRNYDQFGEADMDDFDLDDFMEAAFGEGGSFSDLFAELMAMGGLKAEDEEEMGDMQRSFESFLKASMGKGDADGKVLMPDGSRVPFAALADSEDMLAMMMMAGGLGEGDLEDEDEMEELMAMMGAMGSGGGRAGGLGALFGRGAGFGRVRAKGGARGASGASGASGARSRRRKGGGKKGKAPLPPDARPSGASSPGAGSASNSSLGSPSHHAGPSRPRAPVSPPSEEELPYGAAWLQSAKAGDVAGLGRALKQHPELLSERQSPARPPRACVRALRRNSHRAPAPPPAHSPPRSAPRAAPAFQQPNALGNTALHWAAVRDCAASARWLLERGLAADVRNKVGSTPLHSAAANGCAKVRAGAARPRALHAHHLCSACRRARCAALALRCALTLTAFQPACLARGQVASLLLEWRADTSLLDSSGETARDKAAERGHTAVLELLTQAAATSAISAATGAPPSAAGVCAGGSQLPAAAAAGSKALPELLAELDAELTRAAASLPPAERAQLGKSLSLVAAARAAAAGSAATQ